MRWKNSIKLINEYIFFVWELIDIHLPRKRETEGIKLANPTPLYVLSILSVCSDLFHPFPFYFISTIRTYILLSVC